MHMVLQTNSHVLMDIATRKIAKFHLAPVVKEETYDITCLNLAVHV